MDTHIQYHASIQTRADKAIMHDNVVDRYIFVDRIHLCEQMYACIKSFYLISHNESLSRLKASISIRRKHKHSRSRGALTS